MLYFCLNDAALSENEAPELTESEMKGGFQEVEISFTGLIGAA